MTIIFFGASTDSQMHCSRSDRSLCSFIDTKGQLWLFRKPYPWFGITVSPQHLRGKIAEQRESYEAVWKAFKEKIIGSLDFYPFVIDNENNLWKFTQQIPTPNPVVGIFQIRAHSDRVLILDVHGLLWKKTDSDAPLARGQWELIDGVPPIRTVGTGIGDAYLIANDNQVWSFCTKQPVPGFPIDVIDIGRGTYSGQYENHIGLSCMVLLSESGEVWECIHVYNEHAPESLHLFPLPNDEMNSYGLRKLDLPKIVSLDSIDHAAAVDEDGFMWVWGRTQNVKYFDGDELNRYTYPPRKVKGPKKLLRVLPGTPVTFAFSEKNVWVFGVHKLECGDSTISDRIGIGSKNYRKISMRHNPTWMKQYPSSFSNTKSANQQS